MNEFIFLLFFILTSNSSKKIVARPCRKILIDKKISGGDIARSPIVITAYFFSSISLYAL
jgi:hypothetical protein